MEIQNIKTPHRVPRMGHNKNGGEDKRDKKSNIKSAQKSPLADRNGELSQYRNGELSQYRNGELSQSQKW